MKWNIISLLPKYVVAVILSVLICLNRISQSSGYIIDVSSLLLVTFGGVLPFNSIAFYETLIAITPFVAQMVLFSEFISADMATVSVYIFSRTSRRSSWLFNKILCLTTNSIIYYCLCLSTGIMTGKGIGLKITNEIIIAIALLLITMVAWNTLMMCVVAVCTIKIKPSKVLTISISVFITWIFFMNLIPSRIAWWIVPLVPMSNGLLAAHNRINQLDFLALRLGESNYNLPLYWSVAYFILCCAVFLITSRLWIMRTDFLDTR